MDSCKSVQEWSKVNPSLQPRGKTSDISNVTSGDTEKKDDPNEKSVGPLIKQPSMTEAPNDECSIFVKNVHF